MLGELQRKMYFLIFSTVSSQNASQKTMPNNTTKAGVVVETMSAPNPVSTSNLNKYAMFNTRSTISILFVSPAYFTFHFSFVQTRVESAV